MSTDTESTDSAEKGFSNGAGWLAALVGLWILVTPFFWGAAGGSSGWWGGGGMWLYWSNVISGAAIAVLAGYAVHTETPEAGWLAALLGLWVSVTPFFWGATVGGGINWWAASGVWLYWSNVVSGVAVAVLSGYFALSGGTPGASSAAT